MDISPSILSAQYNNVATSPGELGKIRGSGQFSTSYPLTSNWQPGQFAPDTSTYVQKIKNNPNNPLPNDGMEYNLSSMMPVGERQNDKFEYPKTMNNTLKGDPYATFGLNANHTVPTYLNMLFFSETNVKYIQKRILDTVERITGIRIKSQSENSILVIMNNKYQYSLYGAMPPSVVHINQPLARGSKSCSLESRLSKLNQAVIQECVKEILSSMNMYATYYKDASSLPVPLSRPTYVSSKGANVLSQNIGFTSGNSQANASFNMRNTVVN